MAPYKRETVGDRIKRVYQRKGVGYIAWALITKPWREVFYPRVFSFYSRIKNKEKKFTFEGKVYSYLFHYYNTTWQNERQIEIPIAKGFLEEQKGKRVLEIGNVLSHYGVSGQVVLDKYEAGKGVITEDIIEFKPADKFDVVISVSTLEHVGWDEEIQDPPKVLKAINHILHNCLSEDGILWLTFPADWNQALDHYVKSEELSFDSLGGLKRQGEDWVECSWQEALLHGYNRAIPTANAVLVGFIKKK